jgi:hypothetical protein
MTPQLAIKRGRNRTGLTTNAIAGLDLNNLGSAEVLKIEAIRVDPEYQRDLRHDLVNKIAREYDMVKCGAILVSAREDGSLWAVDGQHRMAGALQAGETEIFAHVVHGYDQASEADLRLARNDRRPDTIQEKFRTRLVMGDKTAHSILEIVGQNGTEVNMVTNTRHGINAIATLEVLYDIDGTGVWLGRVLRCIREAFGETDMTPKTCSASMLKATCWFISQHIDSREATWNDFTSRLGSVGVDDVYRKSVSMKAANGGSAWINTYRALVDIWNYRRQERSKLHWKTIGSITQLGDVGTRRSTGWTVTASGGGGN